MMHELLDYVRREAQNAVAMREAKGTLLCTAYNPKTHAVKGILMPHEVETGWIPVSVAHAGNGFGILVGPKVGDASKAADGFDGDVFDVEFDGDFAADFGPEIAARECRRLKAEAAACR